MLIRWTTKPQGKDRFSAHAGASPAMPQRLIAVTGATGFDGTRASNGTDGRPMGRGGGTG